MEILGFIAVLLSLTGNILINFKKVTGYFVWISSNMLWIIITFCRSEWNLVALFSIYILLCIHGVYKWRVNGYK